MKAEDVLRKVGLYYEDDSMELNDDITVGEALQAMEEFARQESERRIDELIEKICEASHKTNGISTDRSIVTFIDETNGGFNISEVLLTDWLKSLK